jgi:hypothetical protein
MEMARVLADVAMVVRDRGCVHFAFEIADRTVEQPITLGGEILYDYGAFLSGIGFFLMIYFGYEYVSRLMRSRPRHP